VAAFGMRRVPVPDWVLRDLERGTDGEAVPDLSEPGGPTAFAVLSPRLTEIVELVDKAVNDYVNDDALTYGEDEDDNGFPSRRRLSGEYYLGRTIYSGEDGWYMVSIQACCLEKPWLPGHVERNYLGLDVSIVLDVPFGTSLRVLGIDSAVI
jgi:hypothetical protein